MKLDAHVHVVGGSSDVTNVDEEVYFNPGDNDHWFTRILYTLVEAGLHDLQADMDRDGHLVTGEYLALLSRLLTSSEEIDGVVLLALDAVYEPGTGTLDAERTDLWVSNKFLSKEVKRLNARLAPEGATGKRFFFGASVSPNRMDWEAELDFVVNETDAVLIKLIPSAQHIDLSDRSHRNYFRALADCNMPLLCHVGPEYSFPEGLRNRRLDDFRLLDNALACGVTVIAAHCASPVFPVIDHDRTEAFLSLMQEANAGGTTRLWADTSALSLATRISLLSRIVEAFPPEWLLHGSDFPIPVDGWPHLPVITEGITREEHRVITSTGNPLDRDVRIKRGHGFSDSILENAEKVLRLPAR